MKTFIILSHPRCGTSYLCQGILSKHNNIHCFDEIFNLNDKRKQLLSQLDVKPFSDTNYRYVHDFISELTIKTSNLYHKEVVGLKYFNGQINNDFENELIQNHTYEYILLWRKNILQAAVSYEIARKTNQWNKWQATHDGMDGGFKPFTMSLRNIEQFINIYSNSIKKYKHNLVSMSLPFIEIEYENLFNIQTINRIYKFLNVEEISEFKFKDSKLNNNSRYLMIKNIHQIEKEFKCDEYGFIFD